MDPDRDAVLRAQSGSFEAFEELVSRHEGRIFGLAMGIVRQRQDAEDVVQTVFVSALEHLPEFRAESSFGTWLGQIAVNAALKLLRKRRGLPTVSLEEAGEIRHPETIAAWKSVDREELHRALEEAIDALPENHRLVFALRDIAELSVDRTAAELGITRANVKVRLLRARLSLRETLTRRFGDEANRIVRSHAHEESTSAGRLFDAYRKEDAR